jgi:Uma2 family endonuclease
MATSILEKPYVAEDLLRMEDGHRYELIDGQLVERHMGAKASLIGCNLLKLVGQHAQIHGLGLVFQADCGYQIFGENANRVRFADGSFICRGRLPNDEPPDGHIRIAPDLVSEVVSPNDGACELEQKIEEYLKAGIRLIWVVYPSTRRVMIYRAEGSVTRLTTADQLPGEDVLPGFSCRVEELFAGVGPASVE